MARATRSSTQNQQLEKDSQPDPPTRTKTTSKKRKRQSLADSDEQPAPKQLRTDPAIKEEDNQEPDGHTTLPEFQHAGDVPITSEDAQKILDILEMIDTQGLLDRVFPLPSESPRPSNSELSAGSYSFRTLLRESSRHPLSILRSAVQHLLPISFHPRSRPSTPAAQQLRFCNLALFLLNQASFNSVSLPLDVESLFPSSETSQKVDNESETTQNVPLSPHSPVRKRKYALMQHLPTGDWWTSVNSDFALPSTDGRQLKDLPTAHAELVAIVPTPSAADDAPSSTLTLGSYAPKKPPGPKTKLPGPRAISCGSFLDYGPFASFAPSFNQDGVEIGRVGLGETLWRQEERKKQRNLDFMKPYTVEEATEVLADEVEDVTMDEVQIIDEGETPPLQENSFEGLLPPEQVADIISALDSLELEEAVQELLDRNSRALVRLEEFQERRLGSDAPQVEVGSEEWDTAQGISDSLTLLASLRPRLSGSSSNPLVPSPSILRKLHRTLPIAPSRGWYGTIPASRLTALRDDSTLRVKAGTTLPIVAPAPAAQPAPTANPAAAAPPSTPAAASHYSNYSYANYTGAQYRPSAYTQYKTGQTPAYYTPQYVAQTPGQNQTSAASYYQAQSQYATSGQQQYSYGSGSWYSYQPPQVAGTSNSGRGTPQPTSAGGTTATPASSAMPTNYAGFFNTQQAIGQRAVANTVLGGNKPYGTWPASTTTTPAGYAAPTLPQHLRTTTNGAGSPQPGTPAGGHNFYASTPPAAR